MKKKALQEKRNSHIPELEKEIAELRAKMKGLKFDLSAGKIKNEKEIGQIKKNIAQLLTVKTEMEQKVK